MVNNKQMHEGDYITPWLVKWIDFCKANKQTVLAVLGILAVVLIVGGVYCANAKKADQNSWAEYYNARLTLLGGKQDEAFKQIDALQTKYSGKNAALYAQLLKGDVLFAQDNFKQAAEAYQPLLASRNTEIYTVGALSLAEAQQADKNYAASVATMQQFIKANPKSFALPQAYFTLALSQELSGDKTAALDTYKKILESYTKSYYGSFAKDKIAELKK